MLCSHPNKEKSWLRPVCNLLQYGLSQNCAWHLMPGSMMPIHQRSTWIPFVCKRYAQNCAYHLMSGMLAIVYSHHYNLYIYSAERYQELSRQRLSHCFVTFAALISGPECQILCTALESGVLFLCLILLYGRKTLRDLEICVSVVKKNSQSKRKKNKQKKIGQRQQQEHS